jgi:DNA-binding protein YbaB
MIDLFKPISDATKEIFQKKLDDRHKRDLAASRMIVWLTNEARKKEVPDLPKRLEDMQKRTKAMMEDMEIVIEEGKLVVKVAGSAEDTWRMYRLGSSWFEPDKDAIERILAGLFDEAGSYTK